MKVTAKPNTTLFNSTPFNTSLTTSTPPCICDQESASFIDADHFHADDIAADDARDRAEDGRQDRHGNHAGPEVRGAITRCSGFTAIISIAVNCSPAFIKRRISAVSDVPGAAGKQQGRHNRPEFARQRQGHQQAQRSVPGTVFIERVIALQAQAQSRRNKPDTAMITSE